MLQAQAKRDCVDADEDDDAPAKRRKPEEKKTHDVIDLTAEDAADDDDVIVVSDSSDTEVCLGKLDRALVNAYMVPTASSPGSSTQWPQIKVTPRRRIGINNYTISVADPAGKEFGRVDIKTALALAPLMDGSKGSGLRLVARLDARKKNAGEMPGQNISQSMNLLVHLYAPRKYAPPIGRFLSQKQIYLRTPVFIDRGIPYENPQTATVFPTPANQLAKYPEKGESKARVYGTRTAEQIRSEVEDLFGALSNSEDLEPEEASNLVTTSLLHHQKQALGFMLRREAETSPCNTLWKQREDKRGGTIYYDVISGTESRDPKPVKGGILADMMGLGKTLSVLALIVHTVDEQRQSGETAGTLLIAPLSTLSNWEQQIKAHLQPGSLEYCIYHGSSRTQDLLRLAGYDVVITTYDTVASEFQKGKALEGLTWFRIVLDEAHIIREQSTRKFQATCALKGERRWAVTGTPVQNRLDDLGALIKFLQVEPFDKKGVFTEHIMTPFRNADPDIITKLRLLVNSITLRRLKDKIDLPPREDRIVWLDFTADERALYDWFAKDAVQTVRTMGDRLRGKNYIQILRTILRLRLICAHGQELLSDEDMKLTEGLTYGNAIELDDDKQSLSAKQAYDMLNLLAESDMDRCALCDKKICERPEKEEGEQDSLGYMLACYQLVCTGCYPVFQALGQETSDTHTICPLCDQYMRASLFELRPADLEADERARARIADGGNARLSKHLVRYGGPHTKTNALLECLRADRRAGAKSVVFSGWTNHLDLIQIALEQHGFGYGRLDGKMRRAQRAAALTRFHADPALTVFLVSIAAGGLGLNLTAASRAYVMEPQFNPAAEAQAVDRVHRLGQTRPVTVTHFVMRDSFEEKMLALQRKKTDLADLSMSRKVAGKSEAARRKMEELRTLFR